MAAEQMEVWGLLTEYTVTLEHMKFALRFRIEYIYILYKVINNKIRFFRKRNKQ